MSTNSEEDTKLEKIVGKKSDKLFFRLCRRKDFRKIPQDSLAFVNTLLNGHLCQGHMLLKFLFSS